jgi:ParB-like chromosome segregation protein Spo0J
MSELAVHPVAALFPMLADDELDELVADIKARGLLQPIVLDAEGRVLDGRNRLAACEIAASSRISSRMRTATRTAMRSR